MSGKAFSVVPEVCIVNIPSCVRFFAEECLSKIEGQTTSIVFRSMFSEI